MTYNQELRAKLLAEYYQNPSLCLTCKQVIKVTKKVYEAREKKFCNRKCFGKNQSKKYEENKKPKVKSEPKLRIRKVVESIIPNKTLQELKEKGKNYQSRRSIICKNARVTLNRHDANQTCKVCNYSLHVEVCHVKPVKSFSIDAKISEINALENLIYLCPNHHWEFDNGYLKI